MAQLLSHAHLTLILNGWRFSGLASDDPPFEWEFPDDSIETEKSHDGGYYGTSMPNLGGDLTVKLSPSSPSTQWCIQQDQIRKDAYEVGDPVRIYSGIYGDTVQQVSWRLEGGSILNFPPIMTPGQTYEAKLRFEVIRANVDAGRFNAPRTS